MTTKTFAYVEGNFLRYGIIVLEKPTLLTQSQDEPLSLSFHSFMHLFSHAHSYTGLFSHRLLNVALLLCRY